MRVRRLIIRNFRGVSEGVIDFSGHTLLVGGNNIGKSTRLRGVRPYSPDRSVSAAALSWTNTISTAASTSTKIKCPSEIRLEAILIDLSEEKPNAVFTGISDAGTMRPARSSMKRPMESMSPTRRLLAGRSLLFSSAPMTPRKMILLATRFSIIRAARKTPRSKTPKLPLGKDAPFLAVRKSGFAGLCSCARSGPGRARSVCNAGHCWIRS